MKMAYKEKILFYFVILDEAELQELPFRFVYFSNSTLNKQLNLMSNRFENEVLL